MQNAPLPQNFIQFEAVSISYYYSMCIRLNYSARILNALLHIMFDYLWSTWLCLIFFIITSKMTHLLETIIWYETSNLIFTLTFIRNYSLFRKKSVRYYHKCSSVFKYSAQHFCLILTKPEFSWQTLIQIPNTKFYKNPSSGSRVVPCRQTWES
jgi:hypothetical protein